MILKVSEQELVDIIKKDIKNAVNKSNELEDINKYVAYCDKLNVKIDNGWDIWFSRAYYDPMTHDIILTAKEPMEFFTIVLTLEGEK